MIDESQHEKLKVLYNELTSEGYGYFWIVGMRNHSSVSDGFCLDFLDGEWQVYDRERGGVLRMYLKTNDLDKAIAYYKKKITAFNEVNQSTMKKYFQQNVSYNPWHILWIEETTDFLKIEAAYEKLINECPIEDIRQLREIVLAMSVICIYIQIYSTNSDSEFDNTESDIIQSDIGGEKMQIYQEIYQQSNYSFDNKRVIFEKLIITIKLLATKDITTADIKELVTELTYERLIIDAYHSQLLRGIESFLNQQFEKIIRSDEQWFETFKNHLDILFTQAYKNDEVSRDIFIFGKWLRGFIVRLNEFPKYAKNLEKSSDGRTFEALKFSDMIGDLYSIDPEINQLIINLLDIKEPEITAEKLEKLLVNIDDDMGKNVNFLDFSEALMKYLQVHRPFISRRQHLLTVIKDRFEVLHAQEEANPTLLTSLYEKISQFELNMTRRYQEKLEEDREISELIGNKAWAQNWEQELVNEPDVNRHQPKLRALYDELLNQGRYGFWIVGFPKKHAELGLRLNLLDGMWKVYYPSSPYLLETEDLDEAIIFFRMQILSMDRYHCVAFVRTQQQIDKIKLVLDEHHIETFQIDITENAYQEGIFRLFVKNEAIYQVEKLFGNLPSPTGVGNQYTLDNPPRRIERIERVIIIKKPVKKPKKGHVPEVIFRGDLQGVGTSYVEIDGRNYIVDPKTMRAFKPQPFNPKKMIEGIANFAYEVIVEHGWYEKTWNQNGYFPLGEDEIREVEQALRRKSAIRTAIILMPLVILMLLILIYTPN